MKICYLSYQKILDLHEHQIYCTYIDAIEVRGWAVVVEEITAFRPDVIIEREYNDGRALYIPLLKAVKEAVPEVIRAKWFIDTHVVEKMHTLYAQHVDVGFFALSRATESFQSLMGKDNAFWLPLCWPDRAD